MPQPLKDDDQKKQEQKQNINLPSSFLLYSIPLGPRDYNIIIILWGVEVQSLPRCCLFSFLFFFFPFLFLSLFFSLFYFILFYFILFDFILFDLI